MFLVYISENCKQDAVTHSLTVEMNSLRRNIETSQSLWAFDPFPPPYHVKKKLGGRQGRLIAELRTVGEHAVVVFLSILIRGSRAYESFSDAPQEYGRKHFEGLAEQQEIEQFVRAETAEEKAPPHPPPSDAEYAFLYAGFGAEDGEAADELICETPGWVDQVLEERVGNQLALVAQSLATAPHQPGLHSIAVSGKSGWQIWAARTDLALLLMGITTDKSDEQVAARARETYARIDGQGHARVLQESRRVYPAYILADDDLWIQLEKEPVANMALSPEESRVLQSTRTSHTPFPLFINGRAGSGKSTILQYLFSELIYRYVSGGQAAGVLAPPLYLTANGDLLRVARNFVERLLISEASFLGKGNSIDRGRLPLTLDQCFKEFRPFLLSLLGSEASSYPASKRVDFARYRRMWVERFGKDKPMLKSCGPDISWHVIRSYIKGMSSESYLEPGDYEHLPSNQLSVSSDQYAEVFERVWLGWYSSLEKEGYWDDQDLAQAVLNLDGDISRFPAVFCDEAQDFTRLELELLLRLNLYSKRSVAPADAGRVPFAFAGDQFQTLNPTGFRWDSIKASFVEKFLFALDPAKRSGRNELNYHELQVNYRSTKPIVSFGNTVQAMRSALFGFSELRPQQAWALAARAFPVTWFLSNDGNFWNEFRKTSGMVIVVPALEGEEGAFVQADPNLREHIKFEDGVPVGVLSAARAKGCEYSTVLVYGFGEACDANVAETLLSPEESQPGGSSNLPLQYFMTRLYVAVSRAKTRMIVVDSERGLSQLWKFAVEEGRDQELLARIKNGAVIWGGAIQGMTVGNADEIAKASAEDPLDSARVFEAEGISRKDAFLLKQAALAYKNSGDPAKSRECRARALEVDGEYLQAGELFAEGGFVEHSAACFWMAGEPGWRRLVAMGGKFPQIRGDLRFQISESVAAVSTARPTAELIDLFIARLDDPGFLEASRGDPAWTDAVSQLFLKADSPEQRGTNADGASLVTKLDIVRRAGVAVFPATSARIYFQGRRYKDALDLWDAAGQTNLPDYFRAKAAVEAYPQRLSALFRLKLFDEIVAAYLAASDYPLTPEQSDIVTQALASQGKYAEAVAAGWRGGSPEALIQVAKAIGPKGDATIARLAVIAAAGRATLGGRWDYVLPFALPQKSPLWSGPQLEQPFRAAKSAAQAFVVRCLARSPELGKAPAVTTRELTSFVSQYLQSGKWRNEMSINEAGAALEKLGDFDASAQFYDAVLRNSAFKEDWKFANERWITVKERQRARHEVLGRTEKAKRLQKEISDRRRGAGFSQLVMPKELIDLEPLSLPQLQSRPPSPAQPQQATPTLGDFEAILGNLKVNFSRKARRVNLTNLDSMETAYFKATEESLGGEPKVEQLGRTSWRIPSWSTTIEISGDSRKTVSVRMEQLGAVLSTSLDE